MLVLGLLALSPVPVLFDYLDKKKNMWSEANGLFNDIEAPETTSESLERITSAHLRNTIANKLSNEQQNIHYVHEDSMSWQTIFIRRISAVMLFWVSLGKF